MKPAREFLAAYYGADPHHVESDLRDIRDHGCTGIVFCVTEIDVDLFPGRIEAAIRGAKKKGLDVYLDFWGLGGCFATGLMPSKYICYNPDVRRVGYAPGGKIDTENTGTPQGCLNNPKFLSWITDFTARIITTYPTRGVFWDEPKHGYCRCVHCRNKFRKRYGRTMPRQADEAVRESFDEDMTGFLITLLKNARKTNPSVLNMLCLTPAGQAELSGRNLNRLLRCPALDIYGIDPYWMMVKKDISWLKDEVRKMLVLCRRYDKRSNVWIQCHAIPKGRERDVYDSVLAAAECGPDIIAGWGFKGLNNNNWSHDPEQCWDNLGRAYLEVQSKT